MFRDDEHAACETAGEPVRYLGVVLGRLHPQFLIAGTMTGEQMSQRPLFGGMASMAMPTRMQDVSDFRPVPDHQEVHADGATDQSVIVEVFVRSR